MPSAVSLVGLVKLAAFVVLAYHLSLPRRRVPTLRRMAAFVLFMIGLLGVYEGFVLAVREDSRLRDGRVVSGVVVEMYRPDSRRPRRTITTRGRQGPWASRSMYLSAEGLAHRIVYGSFRVPMVDYHYPCGVGRGTCSERDYVSPDLWSRLAVGRPVKVRQGKAETVTARLDENPQLPLALAQTGIATVFLVAAGWLSGRLKWPERRRYVSVAAVVTAVEEVKYRGATRWKVRFAYFDANGHAQQSAAEVAQPDWRPGETCAAVYSQETPDLATLTGERGAFRSSHDVTAFD